MATLGNLGSHGLRPDVWARPMREHPEVSSCRGTACTGWCSSRTYRRFCRLGEVYAHKKLPPVPTVWRRAYRSVWARETSIDHIHDSAWHHHRATLQRRRVTSVKGTWKGWFRDEFLIPSNDAHSWRVTAHVVPFTFTKIRFHSSSTGKNISSAQSNTLYAIHLADCSLLLIP